MGNKIDRLEAEMERIVASRDLAAAGRSYLQRAANRLARSDYGVIDLRYAIDTAGSAFLRLGRRREEVAAEIARERDRVAVQESRESKREEARAKRVERRRERVERTVQTMWDRSSLDIWDWPSAAPSMIREAILIDQQYCPEAWK